MAALVHATDWAGTPLGPIEKWPQSLRTTVSLCLASNFPISIAWGPHRVQIYNDGYWPICGDKHPRSMGQDFKECWLSAWVVIGEAFEQALLGQTRFLENQRMFLDRFGYLEETFFTFSFSPILDESGGVGGLFHPVTELTQQTLSERRLDILRTLADRTADTRAEAEAAALILNTLKAFEPDLPFVLLYALPAGGEEATLAGSVGTASGIIAPPAVALSRETGAGWPLAEAAAGGKAVQVDDLSERFGPFACGPYEEPPETALVFPVCLTQAGQPAYFLVAGVSARRGLDEKYRLFYELLAAAVTNAFTKARAYEQERKRAEALAELDRAKTAFFSNISHEFRTPLTLMLGPLEDALADPAHPLPGPQQERLGLVLRNTVRLQRLVNSLLDFSRIESGRLQASFQPTDLAAYTGELASVFRSAMEKAGLAFRVDCAPHAAPVFVDRDMWEKIVFNLLSNALKFTFRGEVRVSLREAPGAVVLEVSDTGEGIPGAELANLFQRFYRVEGTRSRTHEGTGIGLAFVQELVKLHGGAIGAESEPGRGTTFTVSLPAGSAHLPQDRIGRRQPADRPAPKANVFIQEAMQWLDDASLPAPEAAGQAPEPEPAGGPATMLVVDDNADMREYVMRVLADKNPDWQLLAAGDGLEALAVIGRQKPDLILSDVMMPNLDGFGLLKVLKNNPRTAAIPVIMLSARAGEEATLAGLRKGADDYLVKPFSARELVARVRTQLEITRTRQDHTELKEAEEELKKFKVISDHAFDAFILMREDGTFAYLNDLALKRWGYTRQEALLLRVPDVDPIYQEEQFRAVFARAQREGALPPFETIHQRKDGSLYPVEVSMGAITLRGEPHLFAVARDITQQVAARQKIEQSGKQAQALADELAAANEELRVSSEEVRFTNQELSSTNEQLRRTNADLDNFVYTASHDLKAPILNIEGLLKALEKQLGPSIRQNPTVEQIYGLLHNSVNRFKATIGDLTEVARISKESQEDVAPIVIEEVLREVIEDLGPQIGQARARLEVSLECPPVPFSRKNLKSVLYNLLSNAVKYRAPDREPVVRISCRQEEGCQVLTVADNGLGMDMRQEEKIFGLFKRLHAHVEGSGIGLYIVKRMVENAGGTIRVESEVGVGSAFRVYFKR